MCVCDRLWFVRDLKAISSGVAIFLAEYFPEENTVQFKLCSNCFKVCKSLKIPNMSESNGYKYPPKSPNLPKLDPLTERLVSPRIPFMQIRRLRREGCYGIVGRVITVPVDVNTMVQSLPRSLDDDFAFNVNLKRNIIHKTSDISGFVKKSYVESWLRFLVQQPLHKHYEIKIDWTVFKNPISDESFQNTSDNGIESLNANEAPESELIHAMQQTMMWNEEHCLDIAPGQHRTPESLLFDEFAEELSFPSINFGVARNIQSNDTNSVRSTAYTMCMSEIPRRDRRGATPQHVLYMAMKILRFRVRDGIQNMYRCLRSTETITRDQIENLTCGYRKMRRLQNVRLVDDSLLIVTLALWKTYVNKLHIMEGKGAILHNVEARDYAGRRTLASTHGTVIDNGNKKGQADKSDIENGGWWTECKKISKR